MHDISTMHTVEIKFPILKTGKSLKRLVPSSWEECEDWHVLAINYVISQISDEYTRKLMLTKLLMKIPGYLFLALPTIYKTQLSLLIHWALEPMECTDNKLKRILIGKKAFYGPDDNFNDLTGQEFVQLEDYLRAFTESKEENDLDLLIATIYRPKYILKMGPKRYCSRSKRVKFDQNEIEKRAKVIKKLPVPAKFYILSWIQACLKSLQSTYWRVFQEHEQHESENYGWFETFKAVSGDALGNLEDVENHYLHTILLSIQVDLKNNEKLKSK